MCLHRTKYLGPIVCKEYEGEIVARNVPILGYNRRSNLQFSPNVLDLELLAKRMGF